MKFQCNKEFFSEAVALWKDWNDKINVISRKDADNIYGHHILHSLAIAEYLERFHPAAAAADPAVLSAGAAGAAPAAPQQGLKVLDVGTGGGFPGIPLAMVMPDVRFTLCDSIGKKIKVAQAVCDGLGLKNVECVNCRAEQLPGVYDIVVSRAVTSLANFYPWVKDRFTGSILYLKGGDIEAEISELCSKCGVRREMVRVWSISDWLKDDYFAEKFVIEIGKNYLCTPYKK
ncbi:MAG: 16S rRNA (guanine(527)-N(7))-methyltransferase RsmG [Bacteroidales bacterium]|nr:16S rRNA (guanine(527)-N(7))-methyltransferase RsmG [Bacteroidales bacterium]